MTKNFGVDKKDITSESISSTVSNEMKTDAIVAVVIATICMLLYIWFRFKDIRFATSAVAALLHDVLVTLSMYAIFGFTINNPFIAGILTVVGYSINDTIVIFDRIRENKRFYKRKELIPLIIGVICGTYSSIFICSPLLYEMKRKESMSRYELQKEKKAKANNSGIVK